MTEEERLQALAAMGGLLGGGYPVAPMGYASGASNPAAGSAAEGYAGALGFNIGPRGGLVYRPWEMETWRDTGIPMELWSANLPGGGYGGAYGGYGGGFPGAFPGGLLGRPGTGTLPSNWQGYLDWLKKRESGVGDKGKVDDKDNGDEKDIIKKIVKSEEDDEGHIDQFGNKWDDYHDWYMNSEANDLVIGNHEAALNRLFEAAGGEKTWGNRKNWLDSPRGQAYDERVAGSAAGAKAATDASAVGRGNTALTNPYIGQFNEYFGGRSPDTTGAVTTPAATRTPYGGFDPFLTMTADQVGGQVPKLGLGGGPNYQQGLLPSDEPGMEAYNPIVPTFASDAGDISGYRTPYSGAGGFDPFLTMTADQVGGQVPQRILPRVPMGGGPASGFTPNVTPALGVPAVTTPSITAPIDPIVPDRGGPSASDLRRQAAAAQAAENARRAQDNANRVLNTFVPPVTQAPPPPLTVTPPPTADQVFNARHDALMASLDASYRAGHPGQGGLLGAEPPSQYLYDI